MSSEEGLGRIAGPDRLSDRCLDAFRMGDEEIEFRVGRRSVDF